MSDSGDPKRQLSLQILDKFLGRVEHTPKLQEFGRSLNSRQTSTLAVNHIRGRLHIRKRPSTASLETGVPVSREIITKRLFEVLRG